jgi:hypothetical protein
MWPPGRRIHIHVNESPQGMRAFVEGAVDLLPEDGET